MYFWGYAKHPDIESQMAFEKYDDHTPEDSAKHNQFIRLNEEVIANLTSSESEKKYEPWGVNEGEHIDFPGLLGLLNKHQAIEKMEVKDPTPE